MDFCFSKTAPIVETAKGKLRGFRFNGVALAKEKYGLPERESSQRTNFVR